jgi:TP901 family phage tail tape measure protein
MVRNPFADEQVAVAVSGDTDGFQNSISAAADELSTLRSIAGGAGAALAALGVGGFAVATKSAADFEQALVGVEKVTTAETARALNSELRDMAETVPLAQSELAGIAEQAGRLGLEGTQNIRRFTRVTGEMVTATDLTADQAANAFARLTELTDISTDQVRELGSSVNSLSNNMATSSSEIVESMLRSSAALSSLGVQVEDQLSIASALNEVSESAARAGTRLKRVAQELQDPRNVEDFASALGVSASEFERMRQESPAELIKTLARTLGEGGDAADILKQNLSSVSRQALGALAQNLESVEDAQGRVNSEFEETSSLSGEFQTATDTFNSELQLTKNALRNIAIGTGERTLPALTDLLETTRGGIQAFDKLNEKTDGLAGSLGLTTAAIGGTGLALAAFASGPVGLAAAAIAALAAVAVSDFGEIRTTAVRTSSDIAASYARAISEVSGRTDSELAKTLASWRGFKRALAQGFDVIGIGLATLVDSFATAAQIIGNTAAGIKESIDLLAEGELEAANERRREMVEENEEIQGSFADRVRQRGTRGRRRRQRRLSGSSGTPPDTRADSGESPEQATAAAAESVFSAAGESSKQFATKTDAAADGADAFASSAQQAAEQLSTSEQIISDAERNAEKLRELGLEDRAKEQEDRAESVRELSRSMQRSVVKDQLESGKSPDEIFGGGDGGGAGDAVAAGSGGGGGASGSSPPAWTSKLNTTLGSLQSSIEKLTATAVVADAVEQAIDGATLSLSGTLELEDDVATLDDVDARIKQDAQQNGRRVRDLGIGNIR